MSNFNNIVEVEAVFRALQLSPIEKGMKDIRDAKQRFASPYEKPSAGTPSHRVVLTNGTGKLNKDASKDAELERRISRA